MSGERTLLVSTIIVLIGLGTIIGYADGQSSCSFPSDIRGNWTSSTKGVVEFNDTHISGRIVCSSEVSYCAADSYESWTCVENDGDRYIIRSAPITDLSGTIYLYFCMYLYKVSSTKYIYYSAPNEKHVTLQEYVLVQDNAISPSVDSICDLASPLPTERYHLLVQEDSISSSSSYCPSDLLGNFVSSDPESCDAEFEVCGDQNSIQVTNSTITPENLFLSVNGSLKCMYSLSDDAKDITYLTVYNEDDTLADGETGFVCVAIFKSGDKVSLTQQTGDCIGLESPNVTTPICAFNSSLYCPITCDFSSALVGSWVSTRKGDVTISTDTMTGFEPGGVECNTTACNNAPTTFGCYMKDGDKYLMRTDATSINSESVRIYVCLTFTEDTSTKYIYHHDHSSLHDTLGEYLVTLNAATPVDAMDEVCAGLSSYDPALYNVFIKDGSVLDSIIECPSEFERVYNVSNTQCEYTLGTCDEPTEITLSSTSCSPLPFYTENGTLGCLYSTTSGDTTYLTLYNKDDSYTTDSTYMFTCMAYSLSDSTILRFSQTPHGCHKDQSPTNVTTDEGITFVFDDIGACPSSDDEFPWIIIVIVLVVLFVLIILIIILWYCCCKRKRQKKKGDEENITDDVSEQSKSSDDSNGEKSRKGSMKRLVDVFTIGKDKKKAHVREHKKSKLKHRRGHRGDEESFDSGVTGEDENYVAGKSHKKRRRKKGRKRRKRKRILEDGTEEYVSTDAEDDDGYNDNYSLYSEDFDSDESYTDSEGSDTSQKNGVQPTSTMSKAHQLHIAKAWERRIHDPSLVKSSGSADKGRRNGETGGGVEGDYDPDIDLLPGQTAPISHLLAKKSPLRSSIRGRDKQSSRMSSARTGIRHIASPTRHKLSIDERMEEARERYFHNIPHLGLYIDYTDKRHQMEDEGYWDDILAQKNASELFNLQELDEELIKLEGGNVDQTKPGDDATKETADQASTHSILSRPSTTTHQDQGVKSADTESTVVEDSVSNNTLSSVPFGAINTTDKESVKTANKENQTNSDDEFVSNIVAQSIADTECPRDIKSPAPQEKVTFVGSANLMARFYSKLNQIRTAKVETDGSTASPDAPTTEKTDKRRIRTALRRLLNERLFPDIRPATPVKPLPANGDSIDNDLVNSGTTTPFTLGTKSKMTDDKRLSTAGSKGRVFFVETSDLSSGTEITGNGTTNGFASHKQPTLGYYRRHEGPVSRPDNISRLYQPARNSTQSSSNLSTRDAILKDPDFIKRLKNEIGKHNEKSTPPASKNPPRHPKMSWTYNQLGGNTSIAGRPGFHTNQGMNRKDMEDQQLKKLLEELYQDKKYMDTLISTKGDNATEEEISIALNKGREYLLDRAAYWLEKGPLPPRPPTSELGFRLEREQSSVMSVRSVKTAEDQL